MRMRHLAVPFCLAGLIPSTTGALAAPAEVLAAVNLRTGPGAQYYTIMTVPPGAPVEVYGCLGDNSWCDVGYGDARGWLSSRYLGAAGAWYPERPILRPPVLQPPPIYREPRVYANPPPVYRPPVYETPVYGDSGWDDEEAYPDGAYIAPPPAYVYRPPVTVMPAPPGITVYRARPEAPVAGQPSMPPATANAPPAITQPTPVPPAAATPPAPTTGQSASAASPSTTAGPKPKYGSAVGKPGAPCKWVNGVCRND
ncbi:SH3 domain-containing protein [Pleomorphomonas koreensis]|uniref:SH3 domain-containing protein n=1 Tax=Pleomorphomonas koreensis TaxID=257440 RepID=UPI00041D2836|nr:SH3 domain-containing protein [Pleomorphomonas koreensis]